MFSRRSGAPGVRSHSSFPVTYNHARAGQLKGCFLAETQALYTLGGSKFGIFGVLGEGQTLHTCRHKRPCHHSAYTNPAHTRRGLIKIVLPKVLPRTKGYRGFESGRRPAQLGTPRGIVGRQSLFSEPAPPNDGRQPKRVHTITYPRKVRTQ